MQPRADHLQWSGLPYPVLQPPTRSWLPIDSPTVFGSSQHQPERDPHPRPTAEAEVALEFPVLGVPRWRSLQRSTHAHRWAAAATSEVPSAPSLIAGVAASTTRQTVR